jgi:hypothetical protein
MYSQFMKASDQWRDLDIDDMVILRFIFNVIAMLWAVFIFVKAQTSVALL